MLLIFGGIILVLYSPFTFLYSRWQQRNLEKEIMSQEVYQSPVIVKDSDVESDPVSHKEAVDENNLLPNVGKKPVGLFVLSIPEIDLSVGVVEGTSANDLRVGPGWYSQSALPGKGNTAIAGHLNIYGSWFRHLNRLKRGDTIRLTYKGNEYLYSVERVFSIAGNNWDIIEPCGYNALTLTTCDPGGDSNKRLAVRARLL